MKMIFGYGRKVRVPIDTYNSVEYQHFSAIEYDSEDLERLTIIPKKEYKELHEMVDEIQREIIKEETGVIKLPMDKVKPEIPSFKKRLIKK